MQNKYIISNNIVIVLKPRGKRALTDVNCYWKMTLVVALDGVASFSRLKDVTNTYKRMQHSPLIGGISSVQWRKEDFECVSAVYCVLESKKISSSA